mmetsp:Transcript_61461/g.95426  ORF Transcript_61461/g.95426 Transcript_61461/m.95426 type:complete len:214 (+) Transcript_61461:678-1319(+)
MHTNSASVIPLWSKKDTSGPSTTNISFVSGVSAKLTSFEDMSGVAGNVASVGVETHLLCPLFFNWAARCCKSWSRSSICDQNELNAETPPSPVPLPVPPVLEEHPTTLPPLELKMPRLLRLPCRVSDDALVLPALDRADRGADEDSSSWFKQTSFHASCFARCSAVSRAEENLSPGRSLPLLLLPWCCLNTGVKGFPSRICFALLPATHSASN